MPDLCPSPTRARRPVSLFRPLSKTAVRLLAALLAVLSVSLPVRAEEGKREPWQAFIEEHQTTPEYLIAVDKSRQQLSLFERRSPLKLTRLFVCTTGQTPGDKEREGDLKTPEGVYFVVQRIGAGLEFLKYGTEAYTLNYPNPVDRLRKKSGYGIWIHGRGEPLAPLQTQGCVSLNNEDLASIGKVLQPGTPVALTESFSLSQSKNSQEAATISLLEKRVQAWARAWGQRSTSMFDFYDKEAYGLAQGEPFSRFQAQKERLFKQLPWINNFIRDIRVLRGPGYWVTWFHQDYRAPNLATRGVRRLYWVPDARGEFKIVGMEWSPGMISGTLLASTEPALPPIEARPRTEEQILPRTESGTKEPAPENSARAEAPAPAPFSAQQALALPPALPSQRLAGSGRTDEVRVPATTLPAVPVPAVPAPSVPAPAASAPRVTAPAPIAPEQGGPGTGEEPVLLVSAPPPSRLPAEFGPVTSDQNGSGQSRSGMDKTIPAEARPRERFEAGSALSGGGSGSSAAPPSAEDTASLLSSRTEAWREAWESGNLDAYMAFYAPQARQGARGDAEAIRKHKLGLWSKAAPAKLILEDMRIKVQDSTVIVAVRQEYADSNGRGDRGLKTLNFENINGQWLITQEKWSPLPDEAGH